MLIRPVSRFLLRCSGAHIQKYGSSALSQCRTYSNAHATSPSSKPSSVASLEPALPPPRRMIDKNLVIHSQIPHINTVAGVTFPEFVWSNLALNERVPAFTCHTTGLSYTHAEIARHARAFAAALQVDVGFHHGDRVLLATPNMPQFPVCLLGVMHAGGIVSPANPGFTPPEFARQLLACEARYVVTVPAALASIVAATEVCKSVEAVILIGEPSQKVATPNLKMFFYSEMIDTAKKGAPGANFLRGAAVDTTQAAALLPFSSGTTGLPKGVELTHANLCTNMVQYNSPDFSTVTRPTEPGANLAVERFLGVLPFYHILEQICVVNCGLYMGAHVLSIPKYKPDQFVAMLREFKPTVLTCVPSLLQFLASSPDVQASDFESLKSIVVGGAPVGRALSQKVLAKAGKYICFQEGLGMSETMGTAFVNPSSRNTKLGSCGSLMPGTRARIVDVDSGANLPAGKPGELLVRGPQVMKGYFKDAAATSQAFDVGGWFRTGDIVYYDADGYLYVVDRLKELIKVRGFQVAPAELENLLSEMAEVEDVAVIGVPDERAGELPRAYIVRKSTGGDSETLTEQHVNAYLRGKVTPYKELRGGVEFVETIPKSATGKVMRKELRNAYMQKGRPEGTDWRQH